MEIRGWVLYDDACGFCRRRVPFWGPTLRRRGFGIAPLQSPWVRQALPQAGRSGWMICACCCATASRCRERTSTGR